MVLKLNMDIMGSGEKGITAVNGSVFKKEFKKLQKLNKKLERKNDMKRPDMIDRNQKLKVIIFWKYVMYVLGRIVILKDKS